MKEEPTDFISSFSLTEQKILNLHDRNVFADIVSRATVLYGKVEVDKFQYAFSWISNRHKIFQSRYNRLTKTRTFKSTKINYIDVSGLDNKKIERFLCQLTLSPIDLQLDQLFGATLIKCREDKYIFLAKFHHLIIDGGSWIIIFREMLNYYLGLCRNSKVMLEKPISDFNDYIQFEKKFLASEKGLQAKIYWSEKLSRQSVSTGCDGNNAVSFNCSMIDKKISDDDYQDLASNITKYKVNLNSYMLAAYQQALCEFLEYEFFLTTTLSLRIRREHRNIVGPMFVYANIEMVKGEEWSDKLSRMFSETKRAQRLAYASDAIGPHGSKGNNLLPKYCFGFNYLLAEDDGDLFTSMFIGEGSEPVKLNDELSAQSLDIPVRLTPYGIGLSVGKVGNSVTVKFVYNQQCFKQTEIEKLYSLWKTRLLNP